MDRQFLQNAHTKGMLAALAVFFPYTGKIVPGVPALVGGYGVLTLFVISCLHTGQRITFPNRKRVFSFATLQCALFFTIVLGVLWSATPAQIACLFYPLLWFKCYGTPTSYVLTKLTFFLIASFPGFLCSLYIVFYLEEKESFARGVMWGLMSCGLYSMLKILPFAPYFLSTQYSIYYQFYAGIGAAQIISIAGMSPILGVSSLAFYLVGTKRQCYWERVLYFSGAFFLMLTLFFIYQRFDLAITLFLLGWLSLKTSGTGRPLFYGAVTLFILFRLMCPFIWGESFHIYFYWTDLLSGTAGNGFTYRLEAFQAILHALKNTELTKMLWGHSLGAYAALGTSCLHYPHNFILEALFELGVLPFLAAFCGTLIGFFVSLKQLVKERDILSLFAAILCVSSLTHAMKSGDLTFLGVLFFVTSLTLIGPFHHTHKPAIS